MNFPQQITQPTYDEFMAVSYHDLDSGAFVGSLRQGILSVPDDHDEETCDIAFSDEPESDWLNLTNNASVYVHRADSDGDDHLSVHVHRADAARVLGNEKFLGLLNDEADDGGPFSECPRTFAACHFVVVHGVGRAVSVDRLNGLQPTWALETDLGVYEYGYVFEAAITNFARARALVDSMIDAGLCNSDESGPWLFACRPPAESVAAPEDEQGFQRSMVLWNPDVRYEVDDLIVALGLTPGLTGVRYADGDPVDSSVVLPRHVAG